MDGWKKIAIIVGVVVIVGAVVVWATGNWVLVVNAALKTIQGVIGIPVDKMFQLPTA